MNNKKMLLLLGFFLFVIIVFNIFKNTYAYDYKDYDYTLFYKDNESELTEDIKKFDDWIKNLYETKLGMPKNSLMPLSELIFSDLNEKCYKMITDMKLLHKRVDDELES